MSRILKSHPKSVQAHKDLVLACLDDKDESIRLRALGLLYGMVCMTFKENSRESQCEDLFMPSLDDILNYAILTTKCNI